AELVSHHLVDDLRGDAGAFRMQDKALDPDLGVAMMTEADNSAQPRPLRRTGKSIEKRRIAIDDRTAAFLDSEKYLRLGIGDLFKRVKISKMAWRDRGDDRDMGPHHSDKRSDLAGVVHSNLEYRIGGISRHARQRQGHAPMVVEGCGRRMCLSGAR